MTFYLTLLSLVFREYNIKKGKIFLYLLVVFWCFTVGMTRVFLGVHTFEQISVGFGLGLLIHILTCHFFYRQIESSLEGIHAGTTKFFSKILVMYLIIDVMIVALYNINTTYFAISQDWTNNIWSQCPNTEKFVSVDYENLNKQFTTSGKYGGY